MTIDQLEGHMLQTAYDGANHGCRFLPNDSASFDELRTAGRSLEQQGFATASASQGLREVFVRIDLTTEGKRHVERSRQASA
jgi:hypothetical protein